MTDMLAPVKVSPPITLLQEICSRNGLTASYQLLSTEGSVHEPTFKFAVTVADVSAIASGQSKKKARHAAAREIIERLRAKPDLNLEGINFDSIAPLEDVASTGQQNYSPCSPTDNENSSPTNLTAYTQAMSETNPVGKLQEICMKMRVNPPDYDTADERGLAHERVFYITCSIASLSLETMGQGRSKKLAKRQAAELMLGKLDSSGIYDKSSSNKKSEQGTVDSLHIDSDENAHYVKQVKLTTELLQSLNIINPSELWQDIKLIEEDEVNDQLFYELIHETIPKDFEIKFDYLTDNHCLFRIYDSAKPRANLILTSFGIGKNNFDAMKAATINAYKQLLVLLQPFTGKANHPHLQVVGSDRDHQGLDCQVAMET